MAEKKRDGPNNEGLILIKPTEKRVVSIAIIEQEQTPIIHYEGQVLQKKIVVPIVGNYWYRLSVLDMVLLHTYYLH